MYGIKIAYSWGHDEILKGSYISMDEAYKKACVMAGREAGKQNPESKEPLNMRFNASEHTIEMFYDTDDICCYYSIEEISAPEVKSNENTDCPKLFKDFAISVEEKMSRTYIVEATSLEEAVSVINDGTERIVLDCEDFSGRTISSAEWSDNGLVPEGRNIDFFPRYTRNTKINYLYRDASNYKVPNSIVVPGLYSKEQIDTIIKCLDERLYFIPRLVGFPEDKFEDETEDDHPWFELEESGFEETSENIQLNMSPEETVQLFQKNKGKWGNDAL